MRTRLALVCLLAIATAALVSAGTSSADSKGAEDREASIPCVCRMWPVDTDIDGTPIFYAERHDDNCPDMVSVEVPHADDGNWPQECDECDPRFNGHAPGGKTVASKHSKRKKDPGEVPNGTNGIFPGDGKKGVKIKWDALVDVHVSNTESFPARLFLVEADPKEPHPHSTVPLRLIAVGYELNQSVTPIFHIQPNSVTPTQQGSPHLRARVGGVQFLILRGAR